MKAAEEGNVLTDEEQDRIRHEEIYRAEVRQRLAATEQKSARARIIRFFNTPFGLWILSSLVLSGLTASYSHFQANALQQRQKQSQLERLNSQLAVRLEYSEMLLMIEKGKRLSQEEQRQAYLQTLQVFLDDSNETRLFTDFKDRSTLSLALELEELNPNRPSAGRHSYGTVVTDITKLMGLRKSLTEYDRIPEEERQRIFDGIEGYMKEIDAA